MEIQFSMPVIIVSDIKASREFYQILFGLEIEHDFGENISFKSGLSLWEKKRAHEIVFGNDDNIKQVKPPQDTELYFQTDDMEAMWGRVKSFGARIIHSIKEESWGQRNFRFYDPDGFIIEVGEPIPVFLRRMKETGLSIEEVAERSQMPLEAVKEILSIE